jgi:hypothetical protein
VRIKGDKSGSVALLKQKEAKRFGTEESEGSKGKRFYQQNISAFATFASFLFKTPLLTFVGRILLSDTNPPGSAAGRSDLGWA